MLKKPCQVLQDATEAPTRLQQVQPAANSQARCCRKRP